MKRLTPQEFYDEEFYTTMRHDETVFEFTKEYADHCEETEWVSVEERLPEIDEDVLLFDDWKTVDGKEMKEIRAGYLSEYTTTKSSGGLTHSCEWRGSEYIFNITHWRPLPSPPKNLGNTDPKSVDIDDFKQSYNL